MSQAGLDATMALAEQYRNVVLSLQDDEWGRPSLCAGWRVQDLVAHTGSNWRVLVDPPSAETDDGVDPAPPVTAEQLQESLVQARRNWTAEEVRDEFVTYQERALEAIRAMQSEPVASADMTLSDLGTYPCHMLADAFAFDLYCHLHVDLLAPTGPVSRDLPAVTGEVLSPGIGWMLAGLPQMCPDLAKVLIHPLGLVLTGPGGRSSTVRPGAPFVTVVPGLDEPQATVTSAATDFVLWGTKRSDWRRSCEVEGDHAFAADVLDAINIV